MTNAPIAGQIWPQGWPRQRPKPGFFKRLLTGAYALNGFDQSFSTDAPLWTPAAIPTQLWLDADDAATITQSDGFVSEWRDKSGNSRHAVDQGVGLRPLYEAAGFNGRPTIAFDGVDDRLGLAIALALATTNSFDIFIAASPSANTGTLVVSYPGGAGAFDPAGSFRVASASNRAFSVVHHLTAGNNSQGGMTTTPWVYLDNDRLIVHYRYDSSGGSTSASRWGVRVNGNSTLSWQNLGNTSSNWGTNNSIGDVQNTSRRAYGGKLSELIVTPSLLSADNVDRMYGYLAHHWLTVAELSNSNPYKSGPPYLT
jgi:hypothetical protein